MVHDSPASAITAFITERGWNQGDLARSLGVSRQTANYLVNGKTHLTGSMMLKLAEVTGQSVDYWAKLANQSFSGSSPVNSSSKPIAESLFAKRSPGILIDRELEEAIRGGMIGIQEFEESSLGAFGYEFRLGDHFLVEDESGLDHRDASTAVEIQAGEIGTAESLETLTLHPQIVARLELAPDLAQQGLVMTSSAFVDASQGGRLTVMLANMSRKSFLTMKGDSLVVARFDWLEAVPARLEYRLEEQEIDRQIATLKERRRTLQNKKFPSKLDTPSRPTE